MRGTTCLNLLHYQKFLLKSDPLNLFKYKTKQVKPCNGFLHFWKMRENSERISGCIFVPSDKKSDAGSYVFFTIKICHFMKSSLQIDCNVVSLYLIQLIWAR